MDIASDSRPASRALMLLWDLRNSISDASESDESSFGDDAPDFCTGWFDYPHGRLCALSAPHP
jgi:hypothetical protein